MIKCYKVVTKKKVITAEVPEGKEIFVSAVAEERFQLIYIPNKKVSTKQLLPIMAKILPDVVKKYRIKYAYPLVFKELLDALRFRNERKTDIVFECEATRLYPIDYILDYRNVSLQCRIYDLLRSIKNITDIDPELLKVFPAPSGTCFAKELILRKVVPLNGRNS